MTSHHRQGNRSRTGMTPKQQHAYDQLVELLASGEVAVGAQLPSFASLASRFGVSVKVMQSVVPRLAAEGVLTIQPQVGTYLKRVPTPALSVRPPSTTITLWINEIDELFSPSWRRLRATFEERHPHWRIEATLSGDLANQPLLRRPMLQVLELTTALHRLQASGPWMAWAVDCEADVQLPLRNAMADPRVRPIVLGAQALWIHRAYAGVPPWNDWQRIPEPPPGHLGWVLSSYLDPLYALGLCGGPLDAAGMSRYLDRLVDTPPPALVTPSDLEGQGAQPYIEILRQGTAQVVSGWTWMGRIADAHLWRLAVMPGSGQVSMSAMAVLVRADLDDPEPAVTLARYIAGNDGQTCLAASQAYLPALASSAAGHPLAEHVADAIKRGWPRQQFELDLAWIHARDEVDACLRNLRTGRTTRDEAQAVLMAFCQRQPR